MIASELDLDVCHFDVEEAFVQSKRDEDFFLRLPKGCGSLSDKIMRLNKILYRLKTVSPTKDKAAEEDASRSQINTMCLISSISRHVLLVDCGSSDDFFVLFPAINYSLQ